MVKAIYRTILRQIYARQASLPRGVGDTRAILIVRIDAIGDFVLFAPTLRHIRKSYPNSKIALAVHRNVTDLVSACPFIDEVIPLDLRNYRRSLFYRLSFIRDLRRRAFDLVIHPTYSRTPEGDEITYCAGAARKVGIDGDCSNITKRKKKKNDVYYTKIMKTDTKFVSEIDRNREFVSECTGRPIASEDFKLELWLTEADRENAHRLLENEGLDQARDLIAAIVPGASLADKEWPADYYAQVADRIVEHYGMKIVILGSRADMPVALSVASRMRASCMNLTGKTRLRELAVILESCGFYIGNDTGPLHLAAAVGIPTLCIMGGGQFGRFYPYGDLSRHRMVHKELDCYHCNWDCIHETVRCIQEIAVEDVWRHTQRLMEEVVIPERKIRALKKSNGVALGR